MTEILLITAIVLILCVFSGKVFYKYGVPLLLVFMLLGMLFGSDGLVGIEFSDYKMAKEICSIGLVFIMFYGGFGTNWKSARPIAVPAVMLSVFGVIITAVLVACFCHWVIGLSFLEGMLIGSVVASTDAASVFSILKSRKLNLKNNLAPLLEIESGSNDPFAYLMTVIVLAAMGVSQDANMITLALKQVGIGVLSGVVIAWWGSWILRKLVFEIEGLYPIFVMAIALFAFSFAEFFSGNGYLAVYILGLILGNGKIIHKRSLVNFFDGISWLMQILLFFTLGLLSFPSQLPHVMGQGLGLALFMLLVARPVAVFIVLTPFKIPFKQQIFVSWVGLRGAASLVFAIVAISSGVKLNTDIFHMVFFVALVSVMVQGSLLARFAKFLDLVENEDEDQVLRTFNDYRDEFLHKIVELKIKKEHPWAYKSIMEAEIPESVLVLMIKRKGEYYIPKGHSEIQPDDILILSGNQLDKDLGAFKKNAQIIQSRT